MTTRSFGLAVAAVLAIVAAAGAAALAANRLADTPVKDTPVFALTLAMTGWLGLAGGWAVQRWSRSLGFGARILVFIGLAIAIFVVNTAVAASLMFISTHDLRLLFILSGYALAATAIPALALGRNLGRRLQRIEQAAATIAAGDLSARVGLAGNDDMAKVGAAFDTMAAGLEQANARRDAMERSRRDLFAAISHDLRTPLSSIRVMVEALADGVVTDSETTNRYLRTMRGDVERLSMLVDDLFELARIDSGALQLRLEEVAMEEVVAAALDEAMPFAKEAGVRLGCTSNGESPFVQGDSQRLMRVLANLLQNAIRHTPADGSVSVTTLVEGSDVVVAVEDTGEGIRPTDVGKVFERFYRSEESRSRASGGSGLGLSIAKGIVEAHGGRIWVDRTGETGTVVKFALPGPLSAFSRQS